jgi:superfamily II DNA/RNA helicase
MAESAEELQNRLEKAIIPGFRDRLLDKGLARGLIWRNGKLPPGAPSFRDRLTDDLLDYAFALLAMALRLRTAKGDERILQQAFLIAGEAIEAAVRNGNPLNEDRGFNKVSAAVSFHLARYAARAYSMLPIGVYGENLAPTERALILLIRRSLDEMHEFVATWLLDKEHTDERVAQRLLDDAKFDETDAINEIITRAFMRGLALFDHAIMTGEEESAAEAKHLLLLTAEAAKDMHAVPHWWTSVMAYHLIDDLWQMSLHRQIPTVLPNNDCIEEWTTLRWSYIQQLRAAKRSTIELWPSQIEAAHRAIDPADDLVIALPTGAGKTRIAEICILRALASDQRVIYVAPLRALSAQVERDLAETFLPLGISISSLYGSAGIESADAETLRETKIVVSTPEKLDFALRVDSTIIDDVGLLVLDEGHMLGPSEREVRYEALVQRLLRRSDAASRRIVCLSALFPPPNEMNDLVEWLRQDEPGTAVHSTWRPTRQRFGIIKWEKDAARLDIEVENEGPFLKRFVEAKDPPVGSRRSKCIASDKNELTLAAAWQFVSQDKDVLIYCTIRKSVEKLGKVIINCIKQDMLKPLCSMNQNIADVMAIGTEWLGHNHPAVQCLQYGVALHHGGLPRQFLNEVEKLLRNGDIRLTIASPTLAQGLNLSASVLLVPSIWRNGEMIPTAEFANVIGRAGRAFVDVEGIVLHVVWENDQKIEAKRLWQWKRLVSEAKAPAVSSGLLLLANKIFRRISDIAGVKTEEVIDYITGNEQAWNLTDSQAKHLDVELGEWERDIASLDSAVMALLDTGIEEDFLDNELERVLEGSLFTRQLARQESDVQMLVLRFIKARAHRIWRQTSASQRRGYHVAGVGLRAGQFLDANIANLVDHLLKAETAVVAGDSACVADAIVGFAELVFQIEPFRPSGVMPNGWENALRGWIEGRLASEVIDIGSDVGVDLLQNAISYRLPWAMEAVRVHASAVRQEGAEQIKGIAATAVEVGCANRAVIRLLRAGLNSREAAIIAVAATGASFIDQKGLLEWLRSDQVDLMSKKKDWPTKQSRPAWLQFFSSRKKGYHLKLTHQTQLVQVKWFINAPPVKTSLVIEPNARLVLTTDYVRLGVLSTELGISSHDIVNAWVGDYPDTVVVEYFGPSRD